jgi:ubiquitin-conjugating enzyme E2 variant
MPVPQADMEGEKLQEAPAAEFDHQISKVSKKEKQRQLQQMYLNSNKRYFEIAAVIAFFIVWPLSLYYNIILKTDTPQAAAMSAGFFLIGMFLADFLSGVIHWSFDTWGTVETPFLGTFIRSFREHHLDATEICNHDFIEANADSLLGAIPVVAALVVFPPPTQLVWGFYSILTWTAILICFTNEFHKWSHQPRGNNRVVKFLQDCHLILPPRHHHVHHTSPHEKFYCITNGWMNPFLDGIGFWRNAESVVTFVTGWVPREDDFSWCEIKPKGKQH